MKGGTLQILWHGGDPILSVDFHQPSGLLATAGADHSIKLWALCRTEKSKAIPSATFKANLSYHSAAVNVLRFSPSGDLLASGGDKGELVIWKDKQPGEEASGWIVWKTLHFHSRDVLDLGWSPDGTYLMSGSVDNKAIIWDVEKGMAEKVLEDHLHYVQGVTWDPAGKYVASLSGDRTCRIYSIKSALKKNKAKDKKALYTCQHVLCKKEVSASPAAATATDVSETPPKQVPSSKQYLFHDEGMPSFFRRLSWSPEGSFLLIPSGVEKPSTEAAACSVSYVVSRNDLSRPALQLPVASKPVVATRFCPVIYSLSPNFFWKHDTNVPGVGAFKLPYKLIFAVATLNSVVIYDTEQSCPIAVYAGLHYAPITDLAWSFDAKFLAISSQDGYCTLVGFDEGDLGTPLPHSDISSAIASLSATSSTVTPVKDPSENPVDQFLSVPPDRPRKVPEKAKPKAPKQRRINPKPISEYLLKSALPFVASSRPTGDSPSVARGNQSNGETPSTAPPPLDAPSVARGNQSNAETPLSTVSSIAPLAPSTSPQPPSTSPRPPSTSPKPPSTSPQAPSALPQATSASPSDHEPPSAAPQGPEAPSAVRHGLEGQSDGGESRSDMDERSGGVDSPPPMSGRSRDAQASTPACLALGKETSEPWELQRCSTATEVTATVCRVNTQCHETVDLSIGGEQSGPADSDDNHATGEDVSSRSPPEKPRDQNADIYVRPLKFRRISPKLITEDVGKLAVLKPLSNAPSLPLPLSNALQELQPP